MVGVLASVGGINNPDLGYRATIGGIRLGKPAGLTYAENTGAFLSLGADWPPGVRALRFVAFSGAALAYFGRRLWTQPMSGWQTRGAVLFVVGGSLNWWDRVTQGYVVDFMVGRTRPGLDRHL